MPSYPVSARARSLRSAPVHEKCGGICRAGCFALCGAPPVTVMAPNEPTWRRRLVYLSPTCLTRRVLRKATRRARHSGSRSRSSLDAVFAPGALTWFTPYAHRREVGGQRRGHVLRPLYSLRSEVARRGRRASWYARAWQGIMPSGPLRRRQSAACHAPCELPLRAGPRAGNKTLFMRTLADSLAKAPNRQPPLRGACWVA